MSKLTRRGFLRASAGLSAGVLIVACAPAGTAPPAQPAESEGAAPATEKTTVLVWDGFGEDSAGVDQIVAAFNEQNPDIEVTREAQANMRDILRTALDADAGPDVMYYDTGPGFAGVLARAGLLLELDDAYQQFGWVDRVLPIAKERTTFDGKTYGIGNEVEFIGMFYNQRLFEENGLQEPSDHAELLEICAHLKDASIYPIAFGDQPKWPAGHTFSVFCGNVAGKEKTAQAISAEVPWTDPDLVRAIQIPFVEMREAEFYNPDINAVNYDDANLLFYSGQAAMHLTGTWMVGDYTNPDFMTDPVGFFFYPPVDGKPISPPAGLGSGYFVSKKAKNPEAALKFLDFVFSEETAGYWLEGMSMIPPIQFDASQYNISELLRFTIQQLQENAGIMSYNIDVLTPDNYNTVMFDGFQEVLGGTRSAEDQAAALEAAMQDALAAGRVMDITE